MYKRQVVIGTGIGLAIHLGERINAGAGVMPVSYTHVDVYKRQLFWMVMDAGRRQRECPEATDM